MWLCYNIRLPRTRLLPTVLHQLSIALGYLLALYDHLKSTHYHDNQDDSYFAVGCWPIPECAQLNTAEEIEINARDGRTQDRLLKETTTRAFRGGPFEHQN